MMIKKGNQLDDSVNTALMSLKSGAKKIKNLSLILPKIILVVTSTASEIVEAGSDGNDQLNLIDALIAKQQISEIRPSPDGSRVVFVSTRQSFVDGKESAIWLFDNRLAQVRKLTSDGKFVSHPRWSPSGSELAFKASQGDEPAQIFTLPTLGEAVQLTNVKSGVNQFEWSPTGSAIAFTATEEPLEIAEAIAKPIFASNHHKPEHLFTIATDTGTVKQVIDLAVGTFAWFPDGENIVVSIAEHFLAEDSIDNLAITSVTGDRIDQLAKIEGTRFSSMLVSPDGKHLIFIGSGDGPTGHDLYLLPLSGGASVNLTGKDSHASIDLSVFDPMWVDARTILFGARRGFGSVIYSMDLSGDATTIREFDDNTISSLRHSHERIFYAKMDAVTPPELWVLSERIEHRLTNIHNDFPSLVYPNIIWFGNEGLSIEAAFFEPDDRKEPHPLVLQVHGGPVGRFSHQVNDWAQLLVSKGYAVLAPNVRGSLGYGHDFVKANRDDWGGGDFRDAIAGVDYLVEQGVVDPNRIGIAGWSYGGYLAAWAVTQTSKFKASVAGAAMLDLGIQWGTERPGIIPYDTWFLGTPWTNPDGFRRMSPSTYAGNVTTPTLLVVGENDTTDPAHQNWAFFRTLQIRGIPSELLVYPNEGHVLLQEKNARDVLLRLGNWLDTHIFERAIQK